MLEVYPGGSRGIPRADSMRKRLLQIEELFCIAVLPGVFETSLYNDSPDHYSWFCWLCIPSRGCNPPSKQGSLLLFLVCTNSRTSDVLLATAPDIYAWRLPLREKRGKSIWQSFLVDKEGKHTRLVVLRNRFYLWYFGDWCLSTHLERNFSYGDEDKNNP